MRAWILALPFMLVVSAEADARGAWTSGTFIYGDLCTRPQTGEVAGHRITLRRSPNGDGIVYETAPGSVGTPAQAVQVAFDDATRTVAFSIETVTGRVAFEGTATQDTLMGTLRDPDGEHPLSLRRVLRPNARTTCPTTVTSSLSLSR